MSYHCHGCEQDLAETEVDLGGGPYYHGLQLQNGEGRDVILTGLRHFVAPLAKEQKVEGHWCGPVEAAEEDTKIEKLAEKYGPADPPFARCPQCFHADRLHFDAGSGGYTPIACRANSTGQEAGPGDTQCGCPVRPMMGPSYGPMFSKGEQMHRVTPKVFLVGETKMMPEDFQAYLKSVGAPEWKTDAPSDGENLVEAMGRLCYRSWKPGLNKNVSKVREGNDTYLKHILEVGHGSVIEHAMTNWIFADVSRVFTHELVRHRVGTAFSQESMRFVRIDDLGLWIPEDPLLTPEFIARCEEKFRSDEAWVVESAKMLGLDEPGRPFDYKKKWTSFLRRFAPDGMATAIGFSANFRTLRHLIFMRTSRHAEVEIRVVFDLVAQKCREHWPNIFADFTRTEIEGIGEWTTPHAKI